MCTMRVQRVTDDGTNALHIQKEESQPMCSLKEKFVCMYIYWLLFKKNDILNFKHVTSMDAFLSGDEMLIVQRRKIFINYGL